MDVIRREYNSLISSEEYKDIHPTLTGVWEKDKAAFTKSYEETQKLLESLEVEEDDDEDYYDEDNYL